MNEAYRGILTMLRTFQSLGREYSPEDWVDYIPKEHNKTYEDAIAYVEAYLENHAGGYGDNQ